MPVACDSFFQSSRRQILVAEVEAKAFLRGIEKTTVIRKTLSGAIHQHSMTGQPPVKSVQITGFRRATTCDWMTRRAHKTPRKSVSGRGGLRLAAGQRPPRSRIFIDSTGPEWGAGLGLGQNLGRWRQVAGKPCGSAEIAQMAHSASTV